MDFEGEGDKASASSTYPNSHARQAYTRATSTFTSTSRALGNVDFSLRNVYIRELFCRRPDAALFCWRNHDGRLWLILMAEKYDVAMHPMLLTTEVSCSMRCGTPYRPSSTQATTRWASPRWSITLKIQPGGQGRSNKDQTIQARPSVQYAGVEHPRQISNAADCISNLILGTTTQKTTNEPSGSISAPLPAAGQ